MKASKFSKWIFFGYLVSIIILFTISRFIHWFLYVYWFVIFTVLFLQITNMILRKWVDSKTKYKDSISFEEEKIRFFYAYFGFPITLLYKNRFRQIRKDSYYVRKLKEIETTMKFFEEHNAPISDEMKDEWINCNRYLKLKRLKTKQEEI